MEEEQCEGVRVAAQARVADVVGWAEDEEAEKKALEKGEGAEVGMLDPVCWGGGAGW